MRVSILTPSGRDRYRGSPTGRTSPKTTRGLTRSSGRSSRVGADPGSVLYAEEAISKGRTGWTVSHDDAAKHIDDLVERLENMMSKLRTL